MLSWLSQRAANLGGRAINRTRNLGGRAYQYITTPVIFKISISTNLGLPSIPIIGFTKRSASRNCLILSESDNNALDRIIRDTIFDSGVRPLVFIKNIFHSEETCPGGHRIYTEQNGERYVDIFWNLGNGEQRNEIAERIINGAYTQEQIAAEREARAARERQREEQRAANHRAYLERRAANAAFMAALNHPGDAEEALFEEALQAAAAQPAAALPPPQNTDPINTMNNDPSTPPLTSGPTTRNTNNNPTNQRTGGARRTRRRRRRSSRNRKN
jgi:hypothetical protein